MKKHDDKGGSIKCKHCGGVMRLYRDGVSCLMCGRSMEHSCERCKYTDAASIHAVPQKQVA